MRKLKVLMFLIAIAAVFQITNVHAVGATDPKTGIGYEIKGVYVWVRNDEGLKDFISSPDSSKTWAIDVTSDIVFQPSAPAVYKMKKGQQLVTVKLNTTGGTAKLKEVLEAKVKEIKDNLSGGTDENYFCSVSVKYSLTLPAGITNIGDYDYRNVFNHELEASDVTAANSSVGLDQMIYTEIYNKTSDNFENTTMQYDGGKVVTSRGLDMPLFDEYMLFKDENITSGLDTHRFMVHDLDNMEGSAFFLEDVDLSQQGNQDDDKSGNDDNNNGESREPQGATQTQVIKNVPDTAARTNSIIALGCILLSLGGCVLVYQLNKKY